MVTEDGWQWGRAEIKGPDYQIVRVPGVAAALASSFLAPEVGTTPVKSRMLRKRGYGFDLGQPLPTTFTELMARRVTKQPLVDPNVLEHT